jgi:hypothetical protein
MSDQLNCGGCGNACLPGQNCKDGACSGDITCPAPAVVCDGRCVNTATNPAHCGGCGVACVAGRTCLAGTCL